MGQKIITLAEYAPEVAAEWDYEKNAPETPQNVGHGSTKRYSWICKKGHSFYARVDHRTIMKSGCPYCSGKKAIPGENDLATVFPEIAAEWDYERNKNNPNEYLPKSNKSVSWKCQYCGFVYDKRIIDRTEKKIGCPNCAKEKGTSFPEQSILFYLKKYTEVKNRYRVSGKEIDIFLPEYSIGIEYNGLYYHENKKNTDDKKIEDLRSLGIRVIIVDEKDENCVKNDVITLKTHNYHVFDNDLKWCIISLLKLLGFPETDIDVSRDQVAIKEQYIISLKPDNLAIRYKEIASEWDNEKNGNLKTENFTPGSHHIAYWRCPVCGDVYRSAIYNRVVGQGCPVCAGKKVKVGYNDLSTTHPEIAKQWSAKNGDKKPENYTAGSSQKVIWHCDVCNYEWESVIYARKNRGCPACSNRIIISGYNDLKTKRPEIAKEWHPDKNGNVLPSQVAEKTNTKYWWLCSVCGHEWSASPNTRVSGCGCPECGKKNRVKTSKQTILSKRGSLAENRPDLVDEWDYEANYPLTPEMVMAGSSKKVGWVCPKGHKWNAVISSRKHNACPECGKKKCVVTSCQKRLATRCSLAENRPDLAAEWDYEANYPLTPDMFTVGSKKKVGWICKNGHKWNAVIYSRKKCGCPICAGKGKRKG